ncbi:MAG: bifunctional DedA family/phosphatase PAP2 family protein [Gemmatimonadota bacterium]|nr:bifunctional DedA family/phosphatase PAP2 family protein [Gemmatimonadota bacterium]
MMNHLGRLIADYGYFIVAAFIFFEGIAIPFPTDTTLVTAAAFAAHGRLSVAIVFLVSTVAATAGTTVAFVLGRRGGTFFERHSKKVSPAMLTRTRRLFDRHGGAAVIAGRFIPVARMLISPMAGLSTMSLRRFTFFNFIGAAVWSAVFCGVGYFFGQHPPRFGHGLARAALITAAGMALLVTVAVAGGWLVEESDAAWRAEGTLWHRMLMTAPMRWLAGHSPRARRFLFHRFTPGDYLGLNLTIGLGLSFAALVTFSAIMKTLLSQEAVPEFDLFLAAALRETATPTADAFWGGVSSMGLWQVMLVPGLALAMVMLVKRGWLPLLGMVAAVVGALLLDLAVKHFFLHPHSVALGSTTVVMGTPSGQALGTIVGYGMVGYFAILLLRSHRAGVVVVSTTLALVLAICFGRLYLGERYFSDIVSGLAAGVVWLAACITGLEVARRRGERDAREGPGRREAPDDALAG